MSALIQPATDIRRRDLEVACAAFHARAWVTPAYLGYFKLEDDLDSVTFAEFIGATAVIPTIDCRDDRFEFGQVGVGQIGFAFEPLDKNVTATFRRCAGDPG